MRRARPPHSPSPSDGARGSTPAYGESIGSTRRALIVQRAARHVRIDSGEERPVSGDLVELPQHPLGLAVGVELTALIPTAGESAVGLLTLEKVLHRVARHFDMAGFLEGEQLVCRVAEIELIVEPFSAPGLLRSWRPRFSS